MFCTVTNPADRKSAINIYGFTSFKSFNTSSRRDKKKSWTDDVDFSYNTSHFQVGYKKVLLILKENNRKVSKKNIITFLITTHAYINTIPDKIPVSRSVHIPSSYTYICVDSQQNRHYDISILLFSIKKNRKLALWKIFNTKIHRDYVLYFKLLYFCTIVDALHDTINISNLKITFILIYLYYSIELV